MNPRFSLVGRDSARWFAIRRRYDGAFLPAVSSYGFTRQEPSLSLPPRLFLEKRNATQALLWWLKGEAYESRRESEALGGDSEVEIKIIPRPGRRAEDFEIVVIRLSVSTLEQEEIAKL